MAMLSKALRFSVLAQAGFKCAYCGRSSDDAVLEVDHVQPRSSGGSDEKDNLVAACYDCNRGKRDSAIHDTDTVLKLKASLEQFGIVYVEAYCRNSNCACREQVIKIKDHDRTFIAQVNSKGGRLKCVVCRKPLAIHWVRTAKENHDAEMRDARMSVNQQRYERDHGPFSAIPLSEIGNDTLPQ